MASVHVTPVDDLIDHPADDDCVCGPTGQRVEGVDGEIGWIMVHHSLDGRELCTSGGQ